MSQFFLIEREVSVAGLVGVYFLRPSWTDPLMAAVVEHYGYAPYRCLLVADVHGSGEPLVDAVWLLQQEGMALEETPFFQLLQRLVDSDVRFVLWCSDDYRDIEPVNTWSGLLRAFREQTRGQPADVWLHFVPPAR